MPEKSRWAGATNSGGGGHPELQVAVKKSTALYLDALMMANFNLHAWVGVYEKHEL